MALLVERGLARRRISSERGSVVAYSLSPSTFVVVADGHLDRPHAEMIVEYGNDRLSRFSCLQNAVFDWLDLVGYESICRQRLTSWTMSNLERCGELHLGVASKIVAMGVEVANLALGSAIKTHSTRAELERELVRLVDSNRVAAR